MPTTPEDQSRRVVGAFVVGTSLPAVFITLLYNAIPFAKNRTKPKTQTFPWEIIPMTAPVLLGAANALLFGLADATGADYRWLAPVVGAVTGLAMSLFGRFGLRIPERLYRMKKKTHWRVHVIAPVLYAALFTVVIAPLTAWLLYGKGYMQPLDGTGTGDY
jgi:hypothetical protein